MPSPDWESIVQASSGDVRRLASVWRFSSIPISVNENTAEHSFWVALYAALIHHTVTHQPFEKEYPHAKLFHEHLGEVLLHAIVHDLPECVTGDVVRVFKYATPELKREVDRAEDLLLKSLPTALRDLCYEASAPEEASEDYVRAVVKCADFLSLFQFMRREAMRWNGEIQPFFNRMVEDLDMMASKSLEVQIHTTGCIFKPAELYAAMAKEARQIRRLFPGWIHMGVGL